MSSASAWPRGNPNSTGPMASGPTLATGVAASAVMAAAASRLSTGLPSQSQVSGVVAVRNASRSSRHRAGVVLSGSMPVYSPR